MNVVLTSSTYFAVGTSSSTERPINMCMFEPWLDMGDGWIVWMDSRLERDREGVD